MNFPLDCRARWLPISFVIGSLAFGSSHAQTPAETASPQKKLRASTFTTGGEARNPFWPVGWVPGRQKAVEVPVVTPELFNVTAILLGPPNLAVINGRDYAERDVISISVGGKEERVRIDAIRDGFILLNHRGRPITVPLNRGGR
jgi:hypothetical protein